MGLYHDAYNTETEFNLGYYDDTVGKFLKFPLLSYLASTEEKKKIKLANCRHDQQN